MVVCVCSCFNICPFLIFWPSLNSQLALLPRCRLEIKITVMLYWYLEETEVWVGARSTILQDKTSLKPNSINVLTWLKRCSRQPCSLSCLSEGILMSQGSSSPSSQSTPNKKAEQKSQRWTPAFIFIWRSALIKRVSVHPLSCKLLCVKLEI